MSNEKRSTEVLVDYEEKMSLEQAAAFIETIATKLKTEKSFTLTHAGKTHEISPSSRVELEVKYERKRDGKYQLELEIEWRDGEESGSGNGGIEIG